MPVEKRALIIANSEYTHMPRLESALEDEKAVRKFLLENTDFSESEIGPSMINKSAQEIHEEFKKLRILARMNGARKRNTLIFVYYSGHGCSCDSHTCISDKDGTLIPIESYVRDLHIRSNMFIVSVLDCCRSPASAKPSSIPPLPPAGPNPGVDPGSIILGGQLYLLFSTSPASFASSLPKRVSPTTKSFLEHLEKASKPFPRCMESWQSPSAEALVRTTTRLCLTKTMNTTPLAI